MHLTLVGAHLCWRQKGTGVAVVAGGPYVVSDPLPSDRFSSALQGLQAETKPGVKTGDSPDRKGLGVSIAVLYRIV